MTANALKVLVTGGSGFIGSHVVDKLRESGHEPQILDLRPSPHHDDVETVLGDLCKPEVTRRAIDGCDAVVHLAALADVDEVAKDPALADAANSLSRKVMLEWARDACSARVGSASTMSECGVS